MKTLIDTQALLRLYEERTPRSKQQYHAARELLPGGVSRNTVSRQPYPIYMQRGSGKHLWDLDGNEYLDFCMNYGPNLLGHSHPRITAAVGEQLSRGFGYGAPPAGELEAARRVRAAYPGAERVRFTNSGTEATMYLLRAARAFTGRERIVKFQGAYHGSHDAAQLSVHPPMSSQEPGWHSVPDSEGLPTSLRDVVLAVPYNDPEALERCLAEYSGQVAGVIADVSMNASGLAQPRPGFLQAVAELAHRHGALLLFDEVVTGFRYASGGAAEVFGVQPDLAAFGKCLGAGMPLGAIAGRADVMSVFDIDSRGVSRVPHAGTLNANPLTLAGTLAFLEYTAETPSLYTRLGALGDLARSELARLGESLGVPLLARGAKSMVQVHFGITKLDDHDDFLRRDTRFRQHLYLYMAAHGIFAPVSGTWFIAEPHTEQDVLALVRCVDTFLQEHYLPLLAQER